VNASSRPGPPSSGRARGAKPVRVALITYGCAKNLVDSEVMAGHLLEAGYVLTDDPPRADVVLLNTCGFIQPARDEALEGIAEVLALKKARPRLRVVVAGCYAERSRDELAARFPQVDLWTGVRDFDHIVPLLRNEGFRPGDRPFLYSDRAPRALSTPGGWAYLKISEGCSHECAFCAIPGIKGRYRSRPAASIVREAERLARGGVKELNLISQDSTYYGRDRGKKDGLAKLLAALAESRGPRWVRVLYGYPEEVTNVLLGAMSDPVICPYFDIPFQHADRGVLRTMKRSMDGPKALRLLEKIRTRLPEAAIRTSLIVGFPGEGRPEFKALLDFVKEARFDHLGVFTYSPEASTEAFSLGDPVAPEVKVERRRALLETQSDISASLLRGWVGREVDVLVDKPAPEQPGLWTGRTRRQAPEVDGLVFVESSPERAGRGPSDSPKPQVRERASGLENQIRRVRITSSKTYDLEGKLI